MAEFIVVLIPSDRQFVPQKKDIAAAVKMLEDYFPDRAEDAEWEITTVPKFHSAGHAFERFKCPNCGASVSPRSSWEYKEGWWDEFIDKLENTESPAEASVVTPCCQKHVCASMLEFGDQGGFARFALSLADTGDKVEASATEVAALGTVLGCTLVQVIQVWT